MKVSNQTNTHLRMRSQIRKVKKSLATILKRGRRYSTRPVTKTRTGATATWHIKPLSIRRRPVKISPCEQRRVTIPQSVYDTPHNNQCIYQVPPKPVMTLAAIRQQAVLRGRHTSGINHQPRIMHWNPRTRPLPATPADSVIESHYQVPQSRQPITAGPIDDTPGKPPLATQHTPIYEEIGVSRSWQSILPEPEPTSVPKSIRRIQRLCVAQHTALPQPQRAIVLQA